MNLRVGMVWCVGLWCGLVNSGVMLMVGFVDYVVGLDWCVMFD